MKLRACCVQQTLLLSRLLSARSELALAHTARSRTRALARAGSRRIRQWKRTEGQIGASLNVRGLAVGQCGEDVLSPRCQ